MMLCEGDVVQYSKIIASAVGLYEAKLINFVEVYKIKQKVAGSPKPVERKLKGAGDKRS